MEAHEPSTRHADEALLPASDESDTPCCAVAVLETVMAEQVTNDVVKEAQSVGHPAPIDGTASTPQSPAVNGESPSGPATPSILRSLDAPPAAPATNGAGPDSRHALPNGDSGEHSATDSQTAADASGASDTDISRPGSVDPAKQDANHVRTSSSSVKKPSTFKSVSVTKTFLAKSAVSTPVARPGDKAAPAVQPSASLLLTAKPRLVAKSGTGNVPRALGKVNGASAGPDASKVWNKNQPIPPPPPKQFTDEELKQQYGIHLATRLQADEAGKEAKWADIDDDEDDWAPETVQWMDGTKSSVAVAENQSSPVEEIKSLPKPEALVETSMLSNSVTVAASKVNGAGGTKTILKPGAHSQPVTGKSSLVLKGQPEKPTLVAKPSTTEKKSPWAPLPPVERVSPIQINPPQQQQLPQRYARRDSYAYESGPLLAKEIAPDDFKRFSPDDRVRRGSIRENVFRQQPSVLQRSQDGPAEPSAAFQTSRSSADVPTWGRRRNSSNVSGDQARRMSFDRRGVDMPRGPMHTERRESLSINGFDNHEAGASRQPSIAPSISPNITHAHPVSPYGSVTSSGTHDLPTPLAGPPVENPVEVQKRLMADKIERARLKKQQEQEAEKKAEAERKERLAKRLAALGPPPEPKSKTKEQSPSRANERSPLKDKVVPVALQSPPKPPVPAASGEVAQYGMMKVHQPQPIKKLASTELTNSTKMSELTPGQSSLKLQKEHQSRGPPHYAQHSAQSIEPFTRDSEKSRQSIEQPKSLVHQTEGASSATHKSQAAWSPSASLSKNWTSQVWGPPQTKERALGNGTFDSGYNRGQPHPGSQQQLPVQSATSPASIGLTIAPQPPATQPGSQLRPSQPMYPQNGNLTIQQGASTGPGPIAPRLAKGWGNFQEDIRKDDANMVAKARQDRDRLGEAFRPELRETYKDQRGQAQTTLHDKVAGNLSLSDSTSKKEDAPKHAHEGPSTPQSLAQGTSLQQAPGARASRFFPPSGHDATPDSTVNMLPRGHTLGARPLAMNPEWQARFNKLLEKPGAATSASVPISAIRNTAPASSVSSSKLHALAPAALSKASLDVREGTGPATVSLPSAPQIKIFVDDRSSEVITRKGTEGLFEDREFGSLPTVRLSKVSHLAANEPTVAPPQDDAQSRFKKFENPFTIRRLEAFDIERNVQKVDVIIHLANMREATIRSMPRKRRGPKTSSQYKGKQNSIGGGSPISGSKDRPRKPSQQTQGDRSHGSPRSSASTSWGSNNRSTPPNQPTTWARRAAAPVH
ncbi:hypothetical protein IQ07DRAFT_520073 [Pyrenochaeta sp. DS3sAY3a]|nr:hypothetical protein IQ07DRAFT_520073 [Pyrenochaeta sp. DS3sAY3a]